MDWFCGFHWGEKCFLSKGPFFHLPTDPSQLWSLKIRRTTILNHTKNPQSPDLESLKLWKDRSGSRPTHLYQLGRPLQPPQARREISGNFSLKAVNHFENLQTQKDAPTRSLASYVPH